jgi:hypothetical protein
MRHINAHRPPKPARSWHKNAHLCLSLPNVSTGIVNFDEMRGYDAPTLMFPHAGHHRPKIKSRVQASANNGLPKIMPATDRRPRSALPISSGFVQITGEQRNLVALGVAEVCSASQVRSIRMDHISLGRPIDSSIACAFSFGISPRAFIKVLISSIF